MSEVLISLLITGMILTIVFQQLVTIYVGQMAASNTGQVAADSRQAIDTMADHLRNAAVCTGTGGTLNSALDAATATSFTYYSSNACAKVTYSLSGTNLVRTVGSTSNVVAYHVSSVSFSYFKAATYNTPWSSTTTATAPTAAELPLVCGVQIKVTTTAKGVNGNNQTQTMCTTVRLRNTPVKVNMSGL